MSARDICPKCGQMYSLHTNGCHLTVSAIMKTDPLNGMTKTELFADHIKTIKRILQKVKGY